MSRLSATPSSFIYTQFQVRKDVKTLSYFFSILIFSFALYGLWSFMVNVRNSFKAKVEELRAQKYGNDVNIDDESEVIK